MSTGERLEKLEQECADAKRRNRRLLAVGVVAIVALALAWIFTGTTPAAHAQGMGAVPKTIRANEFILEDADGKPRAFLTVDKGGTLLSLYDENGETRAVLTVSKHETQLALSGGNGKVGAGLGVSKDGSALGLCDEKGKIIWSAPR